MTYDPERDEPIYTEREMEEHVAEAIRVSVDRTLRMAWDAMIDSAAGLPLTIHSRWEQGRVYDPSSLVFKDGRQWISTVQTASEPSEANAAWRLVHYPRIKDDTTPPSAA